MKNPLLLAVLLLGILFGVLVFMKTPDFAAAATPVLTVPQGGTGWGMFSSSSIPIGSGINALKFATSSAFMFSTSTNTLLINNLGISTSSPWTTLTLGRATNASSSITVQEYRFGSPNIATSTTASIDCRTANQIAWPIGTSATTLTIKGMVPGQRCMIIIQNPNASAGALTWNVGAGYILKWASGTTPTQTTTANAMDVWSFVATQGSSTIQINGALTPNF